MSLYGGFIVKVVFVNRQHVKVRGILLVDVGKKKKKKKRFTNRGDVCERILPLLSADQVVFTLLHFASLQDCKENSADVKG